MLLFYDAGPCNKRKVQTMHWPSHGPAASSPPGRAASVAVTFPPVNPSPRVRPDSAYWTIGDADTGTWERRISRHRERVHTTRIDRLRRNANKTDGPSSSTSSSYWTICLRLHPPIFGSFHPLIFDFDYCRRRSLPYQFRACFPPSSCSFTHEFLWDFEIGSERVSLCLQFNDPSFLLRNQPHTNLRAIESHFFFLSKKFKIVYNNKWSQLSQRLYTLRFCCLFLLLDLWGVWTKDVFFSLLPFVFLTSLPAPELCFNFMMGAWEAWRDQLQNGVLHVFTTVWRPGGRLHICIPFRLSLTTRSHTLPFISLPFSLSLHRLREFRYLFSQFWSLFLLRFCASFITFPRAPHVVFRFCAVPLSQSFSSPFPSFHSRLYFFQFCFYSWKKEWKTKEHVVIKRIARLRPHCVFFFPFLSFFLTFPFFPYFDKRQAPPTRLDIWRLIDHRLPIFVELIQFFSKTRKKAIRFCLVQYLRLDLNF